MLLLSIHLSFSLESAVKCDVFEVAFGLFAFGGWQFLLWLRWLAV